MDRSGAEKILTDEDIQIYNKYLSEKFPVTSDNSTGSNPWMTLCYANDVNIQRRIKQFESGMDRWDVTDSPRLCKENACNLPRNTPENTLLMIAQVRKKISGN